MLIPINWVKNYVNIDDEIKELADMMTMTGSKVEEVITLGADISSVVVGKILSVNAHPDADKLVVCSVDVGTEVIQIVTGASNVAAEQLIPVAVHGARLPGGTVIKRGKLRGIESQGMMCSGEELKLKDADYPGAEFNGIMILQEDYPLGMDIKEALELGGDIIDFEITSNRSDCLSVIGMAREFAVTTGGTFIMSDVIVKPGVDDIKEELKIKVEDTELCPRYVARVVKDIKIEPSPQWMRRRLAAAGVRPINNIVDITNYVMLEIGQPMHAFDLNMVSGRTIIVRNAGEGEEIITLDGKKRELTTDMLVIADNEKPIAIAGVMGGANSEITSETSQIVLESAVFKGTSIRLTSKALGLRSEASARFEKGLDINMVTTAVDRAAQLIQELGAGTIVDGTIDVLGTTLEKRNITVKWNRINQLLGLNLSIKEISDILVLLGLKVNIIGDSMDVIIPTYRNDIEGVADLAEEVARIYGYNKIPMTLMEGSASRGSKTRNQKLIDMVKETMTSMGLYEVVTYSITSPNIYASIGISNTSEYPISVKIANPLGEDQSIMRTTMMPSLLDVLSRNYNRRLESCSIFEVNPVFHPKALPLTELPVETLTLALGEYGDGASFYTLKGKIEGVISQLGLEDKASFISAAHSALHPGRTAEVLIDGQSVGILGEVHPKVAENYQMDIRVFVAELNLQALLDLANTDKHYKALPRYPAVTRDLALVVEKKILAAQIQDTIKKSGGNILESVSLFDIYEGSQIPVGFKSMAYALTYRANDRTLKDEEVNKSHQKILKALENELGAKLR